MEILSVTDDPNFDDDVKAEEELAAKEGRNNDDDDDDDDAKSDDDRGGASKRKTRLNVGNMGEESGSDSSVSEEEDDDDDDENFEDGDDDDDGEEKRKNRTPKKKKTKKKRKKMKNTAETKDSKGNNNNNNSGGDHDAIVRNMKSELRTSALQSGLLAYLRAQGDSGDPTYTYAQRFYLAQWFKDAQDEAKVATTNKNKSAKKVSTRVVTYRVSFCQKFSGNLNEVQIKWGCDSKRAWIVPFAAALVVFALFASGSRIFKGRMMRPSNVSVVALQNKVNTYKSRARLTD